MLVQSEWSVITAAPFSFVLLCLAAFTLAYVACRWRYNGIIDQLREQIKSLQSRLEHWAELAESYKERALKHDEKVSDIVAANPIDLYEKTTSFVSRLREFIQRRREQCYRMTVPPRGEAETETQRLWDRYSEQMLIDSNATTSEWERSFKVDAMLLRDELLSRLSLPAAEGHKAFIYERPTNFFGYDEVASDLERLAKTLISK